MLKNKKLLLSLIGLVLIAVILYFIKPASLKEDINEEEKQKITKELISFINKNKIIEWDQYQTDIDFSEISEQQKLEYAYWVLANEYDSFEKEVPATAFENLFKEVFGDTKFNHQSLKCSICGKELLTYDSEKKTYKYSDEHLGHGRTGNNITTWNSYSKPLKLEIDKDKYKLTVVKIYMVGYDTGIVYGSSIRDEKSLLFEYGTDIKTMEEIVEEFEDNYEKYEDKLVEYIYTFTKENSNYALTNYEIVD